MVILSIPWLPLTRGLLLTVLLIELLVLLFLLRTETTCFNVVPVIHGQASKSILITVIGSRSLLMSVALDCFGEAKAPLVVPS